MGNLENLGKLLVVLGVVVVVTGGVIWVAGRFFLAIGSFRGQSTSIFQVEAASFPSWHPLSSAWY